MEYDLPFFNPHSSLPNYDTLSSSAQAAQAAQQASYSTPPYSAPPPPPQSAASRQPPIINTHHSISTQESQPASARNPRLSHFFDGDQQLGHQYLSTGQVNLSRSASLGNVIGSSNAAGLGSGAFSSRRNRNHMPSDLESAYLDDSMQTNLNERHQPHRSLGTTQQMSQSFYPPSVTYATSQQAQLTGHSTNSSLGSTTTSDPYQQESQYSNTPGQARGHTTTAKMEDAPASARSPRRGQTGQGTTPLLDPYSQLQQMSSQSPGNAYSPTSAVYQQYSSPPELSAASPYQPPQQQASVKPEARSPPLGSPFAGQRTLPPPPAQTSSQYHYPMDTTSPGPSQSSQGAGQHQYASQSSMPLRQTVSTPNTPLSYQHAQQLGQAQYHTMPQEDSMAIETSVHKRRASGFKRVRDSRDLKPYVNNQPAGRRQDANGQYLSVSSKIKLMIKTIGISSFLCLVPLTLCYYSPCGSSLHILRILIIFAIHNSTMNRPAIPVASSQNRLNQFIMMVLIMKTTTIFFTSTTAWVQIKISMFASLFIDAPSLELYAVIKDLKLMLYFAIDI